MECVCFTLIVDDIVLPDGETVMGVLGGGGPQTLFGYQLVANQNAAVGLSAGVGPDLPKRCKDWLEGLGVDTSGLMPYQRPTPRAWQVFEEWGRRTQIWRGRGDPCDELYEMLRPKYDTMPAHFRRATNYHLGIHPLHPPRRLMSQLRKAAHANGGVLSIEPYTAAEEPAAPEQVATLLAHCDIFSPNEAEAESIVGPGPAEELARRLLSLSPPGGADIVVLRCGPDGVLVARRPPLRRQPLSPPASLEFVQGVQEVAGAPCVEAGSEVAVESYRVPAVEDTRVVDVTGCGNAFCGGFLAALYHGRGVGLSPCGTSGQRGHSAGLEVTMTAGAEVQRGPESVAKSPQAGRETDVLDPEDRRPAWVRTGDLRLAGAWGCVAASFMAEERGVPLTPVAALQEKACKRLEALLPRVHPMRLSQTVTRKVTCNVVAGTTTRNLSASSPGRTTFAIRAVVNSKAAGYIWNHRTVRV